MRVGSAVKPATTGCDFNHNYVLAQDGKVKKQVCRPVTSVTLPSGSPPGYVSRGLSGEGRCPAIPQSRHPRANPKLGSPVRVKSSQFCSCSSSGGDRRDLPLRTGCGCQSGNTLRELAAWLDGRSVQRRLALLVTERGLANSADPGRIAAAGIRGRGQRSAEGREFGKRAVGARSGRRFRTRLLKRASEARHQQYHEAEIDCGDVAAARRQKIPHCTSLWASCCGSRNQLDDAYDELQPALRPDARSPRKSQRDGLSVLPAGRRAECDCRSPYRAQHRSEKCGGVPVPGPGALFARAVSGRGACLCRIAGARPRQR